MQSTSFVKLMALWVDETSFHLHTGGSLGTLHVLKLKEC